MEVMRVRMHANVDSIANIMNSNVKMEIAYRNKNSVIVFTIVVKMTKPMSQKNVRVTVISSK